MRADGLHTLQSTVSQLSVIFPREAESRIKAGLKGD
jgi:hypothetical protein